MICEREGVWEERVPGDLFVVIIAGIENVCKSSKASKLTFVPVCQIVFGVWCVSFPLFV